MQNNIVYHVIEGIPNPEILRGIVSFYESIFGAEKTAKVINRFETKLDILTIVAMHDDKIIGFKAGYSKSDTLFYSWLGGVAETFRGQNIASTLLQIQHTQCREKGYKTIQTKTLNRWRNMLILNIKYGFDITETYIDSDGILKIILEKKL